MRVCKLESLVIDEEEDALFGRKKRAKTGIGYVGIGHGIAPRKGREALAKYEQPEQQPSFPSLRLF
jgi:hypothetical protein